MIRWTLGLTCWGSGLWLPHWGILPFPLHLPQWTLSQSWWAWALLASSKYAAGMNAVLGRRCRRQFPSNAQRTATIMGCVTWRRENVCVLRTTWVTAVIRLWRLEMMSEFPTYPVSSMMWFFMVNDRRCQWCESRRFIEEGITLRCSVWGYPWRCVFKPL